MAKLVTKKHLFLWYAEKNRHCQSFSMRDCTQFSSVRASQVAQLVKNLPTMQEKRVQSLGWEDQLEKEMATHSSTLACKIS